MTLNDSDGKRRRSIFFNPSMKKESEVDVENYDDILNEDIYKRCKSKFRCSQWDMENIKRALKKKDKNTLNSGVLVQAYEFMEDKANDILKSLLLFDCSTDRGCEIVPYMKGYNVMCIQGSSGTGKSVFAAKVIENSIRGQQKVFLLSKQVGENIDPALQNLEDAEKIEIIPVDDPAEYPSLETLAGNFILADDLEGLPTSVRNCVSEYLDQVMTCGRKLGITIIYSCHLVNSYTMKHLVNESRWLIKFPTHNKWKISQELRLKYGYSTEKIREIMSAVKVDKSRYLIFHLHYPNFYATKKRVVLL